MSATSPRLHVGKLSLQVIGLDPDVASDQVDHLHAGSYQLPFLHMTLADRSGRRGDDAGICKVDLGHNDGRLLGFDIRLVECVLGVERSALCFCCLEDGAAALERTLGSSEVRLPAGKQSGIAVRVGDGSFEFLMGGGF